MEYEEMKKLKARLPWRYACIFMEVTRLTGKEWAVDHVQSFAQIFTDASYIRLGNRLLQVMDSFRTTRKQTRLLAGKAEKYPRVSRFPLDMPQILSFEYQMFCTLRNQCARSTVTFLD